MDPKTSRFVEEMGLQFERDAYPRTAGRVFGLLLVSPEGRTIEDIADALMLSRTSVGENVRLMERVGVLERIVKAGDRRDHFRVSADILTRLIAYRLGRLRQFREAFAGGLATPEARDSVVKERISSICEVLDRAIEAMARACEGEGFSCAGDVASCVGDRVEV